MKKQKLISPYSTSNPKDRTTYNKIKKENEIEDKYNDLDGAICPVCNGNDLQMAESITFEDWTIVRFLKCNDCLSTIPTNYINYI